MPGNSRVLRMLAMAPVDRLPPPPAVPVRSPPAAVKGEVEVRIDGIAGGPAIEARVAVFAGAERAVVLCHPHPLYGGSMHSPVPLAIAKYISEAAGGLVTFARFNFRGVGSSEGTYDDGRGEVDDALAVIAYVRAAAQGIPLAICGHSFGSAVALTAAARDGGIDRALLVAPSARFFAAPEGAFRCAARVTIFIGDSDEFCDVTEARALAAALGADLRVFEGFDHHFLKSRRALAEAALPVIAPEVSFP